KTVDVMVPTPGETVTEATAATWSKKVGDAVAQDEMLCELEPDKVSAEVPSPVAGGLAEILAEEGATVDAGARLAIIAEGAAGGSAGGAGPGDAPVSDPDRRQEQADMVNSPGAGPEQLTLRSDVEDAPSAEKAMAESGLSRDQLQGSGRDGRVMKEDVARGAAAPAPAPAPAPRAPSSAEDGHREERVKMTRLRATIARRLKDAQN